MDAATVNIAQKKYCKKKRLVRQNRGCVFAECRKAGVNWPDCAPLENIQVGVRETGNRSVLVDGWRVA